jgi:hypothetical protein
MACLACLDRVMGLKKLATYYILRILHKGLLGRRFRVMSRDAVSVPTEKACRVEFYCGSQGD